MKFPFSNLGIREMNTDKRKKVFIVLGTLIGLLIVGVVNFYIWVGYSFGKSAADALVGFKEAKKGGSL
ncbi:MAG: hypothetical protein AAF388_05910 [Bacteroidota bacterium]